MENTEMLRDFFGWCTILNFSLLIVSAVAVTIFRTPIVKIHSCMTGLETEDLLRGYFQYLANYKIAIFIFCLAPYVALCILA